MTYLLDTNACIQLLKGDARSPVALRLAQMTPDQVRLCTPVISELFYGAYKSVKPDANLQRLQSFCPLFETLLFDKKAAQVCGQLRAKLAAKGTPIGPYDLQIAAIAVVNSATLVTHNVAEFSRVPGLVWEDWES
jgi:tRNA(fMet)-specific endonuclease VapC